MRFSTVSNQLRSSEIRNLMKLATREDMISFAGGMPGNELFPLEAIDKIFATLPKKRKQEAFQYGPTAGLPSLLESLSEYLSQKGLPVDSNRLLITTGSLQAINILAKVFLDPGDRIVVENPCFIGAISAFQSYQAQLEPIGLDTEGLDLEQLENALAKAPQPKLLYLTPNFHNPAGILYSKKRKNDVLTLLKDKEVVLLEDDAYGDLYFYDEDRPQLTPMKILAPEGVEICYTGSFSKILGPGFRLGWMLVPESIYQKCELIKQSVDACSPSFTQVLADEFLRQGEIWPYLERIRPVYKSRAEAMVASLQNEMPESVKFQPPKGGFYIWLELPKHVESTRVLKRAIEGGAVFVVGSTFDPVGKNNHTLRLSYCNTSKSDIEKGISVIAKSIKAEM